MPDAAAVDERTVIDAETGEIIPAAQTSQHITPTSVAVEAVGGGGMLIEHVPVGRMVEAQAQYDDLCRQLLDASDYMLIGTKPFKKKSAWKKLSVAFGVSTQIIDRVYDRDAKGRIVRAEFIVRATAPNGRFSESIGACDLYEKCCPGEGVCAVAEAMSKPASTTVAGIEYFGFISSISSTQY